MQRGMVFGSLRQHLFLLLRKKKLYVLLFKHLPYACLPKRRSGASQHKLILIHLITSTIFYSIECLLFKYLSLYNVVLFLCKQYFLTRQLSKSKQYLFRALLTHLTKQKNKKKTRKEQALEKLF